MIRLEVGRKISVVKVMYKNEALQDVSQCELY